MSMEREIKFRVWHVSAKKILHERNGQIFLWEKEKQHIVFMQYTGLKDKWGREIYESDLVIAKRGNTALGNMNEVYEIVWHEQYACFCYKCVKSDNEYKVGKIAESNSHPYFVSSNITEIIGNIYEHPHLLTQKQSV